MTMSRFSILVLAIFTFLRGNSQEVTLDFSTPQKMPATVNSDAEESFPILTKDGKTLYFARTYHKDNVGGKYAGQDIYYSKLVDGVFSEAAPLQDLNDVKSNVVVGISADNQRLYLLNQYSESPRHTRPGVSMSTYDPDENRWAKPKTVFVPDLEVQSPFYSVFVSPLEDFMLFSLPTSSGDSANNDIYVSLSSDGGNTWQSPFSVGAAINTDKDEISPYYDAGRKVLFFSTNGRSGDDHYNIHYTTRLDDSWTSWSMPQKTKINSAGFDAYFFTAEDGTAYFSTTRQDSLANIYISEISPGQPETPEDEVVDIEEEPDIAPTEREHELIIETGESKSSDRQLGTMTREELLSESTIIRFVYFGFDKYHITPKYIEVLDDIAEILDDNPDLYVKINGHTDAIGTDAYNQVLSENRAGSTKEWLVMNGIDPSRVITEGFGKREPYASNATPDGRAMNRRVEIFFRLEK